LISSFSIPALFDRPIQDQERESQIMWALTKNGCVVSAIQKNGDSTLPLKPLVVSVGLGLAAFGPKCGVANVFFLQQPSC
jgi:hypothetical protein